MKSTHSTMFVNYLNKLKLSNFHPTFVCISFTVNCAQHCLAIVTNPVTFTEQ